MNDSIPELDNAPDEDAEDFAHDTDCGCMRCVPWGSITGEDTD